MKWTRNPAGDLVSADKRFKIMKNFTRTYPWTLVDMNRNERETLDTQTHAKERAEVIAATAEALFVVTVLHEGALDDVRVFTTLDAAKTYCQETVDEVYLEMCERKVELIWTNTARADSVSANVDGVHEFIISTRKVETVA